MKVFLFHQITSVHAQNFQLTAAFRQIKFFFKNKISVPEAELQLKMKSIKSQTVTIIAPYIEKSSNNFSVYFLNLNFHYKCQTTSNFDLGDSKLRFQYLTKESNLDKSFNNIIEKITPFPTLLIENQILSITRTTNFISQ